MDSHLSMNQSATYQICVQGCLPDRWLDLFENWQTVFDDEQATTTLIGPVADQAALHGILQTLYGVGLPILSVEIQQS